MIPSRRPYRASTVLHAIPAGVTHAEIWSDRALYTRTRTEAARDDVEPGRTAAAITAASAGNDDTKKSSSHWLSTLSSKRLEPNGEDHPVSNASSDTPDDDPKRSTKWKAIVLIIVGAGVFAGIVPSWVLYLFWPSGFSDYCCCYECCFECCCPGCNGACECC